VNKGKTKANGNHREAGRSTNVGQLLKPEPRDFNPEGIPVERMVHYQDLNTRLAEINHFIRTGSCPECEQKPISCQHRAGGEMFCRICGHRWRI